MNGVGILQRAIAPRIGAGDRPVVVGINALKRAVGVLRTVVLRIGALEWPHGALRRLLLILVVVLLLTANLRECSPSAEQYKRGDDTLRV